MASVTITRMMDNLRLRLPGALDGAIQLELFNAWDEFFCGTQVWREDITFDVTTTDKTYELIPTGNCLINALIGVVDNGGFPVNAVMDEPGTLILTSYPPQAAEYVATVSLTVNDPVDNQGYPEVPSWIADKYGLAVMDGVVAKMMSQPAKPYSSERLAIYHLRRFEQTIASARVDAMRRNVYNTQTWRFPQTFAVRGRR